MKPYAQQVGGAQRDHFLAMYLPEVLSYAEKKRYSRKKQGERLRRASALLQFYAVFATRTRASGHA